MARSTVAFRQIRLVHRSHADTIWESSGWYARAMRSLLTPLGWLYGGATALRNRAFDAGVLSTHALALPSISVGNLTVGGTA